MLIRQVPIPLFFLWQIVLCNRDIRFQDTSIGRVFPSSQTHVLFGMICIVIHNFGCSLSCNCIMKPIMNHRIEIMRCWRIPIIINATLSIYICNLLPNSTFTGTDGTYSFKQLLKVILPKHSLALLQAVIIKNKSFFMYSFKIFVAH